jgi:hypothetical protein
MPIFVHCVSLTLEDGLDAEGIHGLREGVRYGSECLGKKLAIGCENSGIFNLRVQSSYMSGLCLLLIFGSANSSA